MIRWRKQAEADLTELFEYLLQRNPAAARRVRHAIIGPISLLAKHPALGRTGRVASTRELVVAGTPYLVAYTVDRQRDTVVILRILHGARRWPDEPFTNS